MRDNSKLTHHLAKTLCREEDLRIKDYYRGFCNSKTFLGQDIVYSLTTTPGALGGRSGMGLSGTVTSDSSTSSGLSSVSLSTLAEDQRVS